LESGTVGDSIIGLAGGLFNTPEEWFTGHQFDVLLVKRHWGGQTGEDSEGGYDECFVEMDHFDLMRES
jgi:hypothetical protein